MRGSARSIARLLDLYGVSDPPRAHAVSRAVLSTREFGVKQIIRGKDASRFGHREGERGREIDRVVSIIFLTMSEFIRVSIIVPAVSCTYT